MGSILTDKLIENKTLIDQLMEIKNDMVHGSRITYAEFCWEIIRIVRHFSLPDNQSIALLNCLDRYIPDCCECEEHKIRSWVLNERQIKSNNNKQKNLL